MAETPEKVESFINELFSACHPAALRDFDRLRDFARGKGHSGEIERWDWAYYSEKLKKVLYNIDDEILKAVFKSGERSKCNFWIGIKLYGLHFSENKKIPVYHSEVKTWEVTDHDGSLLCNFIH